MPFNTASPPDCFSPKSVEGAEKEGDTSRKCHERVHIGRGMAQLQPRTCKKLATATHKVGQCNEQRQLVGYIFRTYRQPTHRQTHTKQGKKPRQHNLTFQQHQFSPFYSLYRTSVVNQKVVTDAVYRLFHLFERDFRRFILHQSRSSG